MSVSSTSSVNGSSDIQANEAGYTAARTLKQTLGSDDFLKLLSTQMASQDPLKPMDDTAFISQMASFSSLNVMNQLSKDFTSFQTSQAAMNANSFIGRTLTVTSNADSSKTVTGMVTGVDLSASSPTLQIAGESYPLSSIRQITATTSTDQASG